MWWQSNRAIEPRFPYSVTRVMIASQSPNINPCLKRGLRDDLGLPIHTHPLWSP